MNFMRGKNNLVPTIKASLIEDIHSKIAEGSSWNKTGKQVVLPRSIRASTKTSIWQLHQSFRWQDSNKAIDREQGERKSYNYILNISPSCNLQRHPAYNYMSYKIG